MGRTPEAVYQESHAWFTRELEENRESMGQVRCMEDVARNQAQGKISAMLTLEDGAVIREVSQVDQLYAQGVRMVALTWNFSNSLGHPNSTDPAKMELGLTALGRDVVARMEELGMVVDVSHLSDPGFWDVMEVTEKPVMASHSNSRNVHFHTRNLTDEQITAIIQTGGVVGLNLCIPFVGNEPVTEDQLFAHIEHILDLGGEHALALGGDWDGIDQVPLGYGGVWGWEKLYESMLRRGYREELVRGIFFDNMMRVVSQVCIM